MRIALGTLNPHQSTDDAQEKKKKQDFKSNSVCSASDLLKYAVKRYCSTQSFS